MMSIPTRWCNTFRKFSIHFSSTLVGVAIATSLLLVYMIGADYVYWSGSRNFRSKQPLLSLNPIHDVTQAAHNQTLGFGEVFYISLPYRTDRQDGMELMAASTNVRLTYIPGVIGNSIHDKAKPEHSSSLRPAQLGCWRSHADTWRRVINSGLETALILEDDVDWDVNIHDIYQELSHQMRMNKIRSDEPTAHERKSAPYGLDWDILYVGTCWHARNTESRPKHQAYRDPFAPGRGEMEDSYIHELESLGITITNDTQQRVLTLAWSPFCTLGYAVTRHGAQRLLYNTGVRGFVEPVDITMIQMIQRRVLRAYVVLPPLVTTWKTGKIGDSDIKEVSANEKEGMELERGSQNLMRSAREALLNSLGDILP